MKHKITNQKGFTVLELSLASVLVLVLTTAGIYTLNKVSISESNKEQTTQNIPEETEKLKVTEAEKTDKVSVPAEEPKAKPTPPPAPVEKKVVQTETKPTYTSISINMADADINATRALFSANWSGSYSGKCYLTIKNLTTATYISKEVAVNNGTSCNLEVAKAELPAGSYKYYISFKNNEYTVKGSADYKTFNL